MITELLSTQNQIHNTPDESGEIILYQPNENIKIEVRLDSNMETVWLTQQQIAELFATKRPAVTKHLANIFKSGELDKDSTCSILEHMGNDGKQKYSTTYYNLDAIISVGYRINSINATFFRRWATTVLKEHLLRGYSVNHQLVALQERTDERFADIQKQIDEQKQQVEFLVDIHKKSSDHIFPTGCVFDAWEFVAGLVREAKSSIVLIDNFCDERTLMLLSKRNPFVSCTIYTRYNPLFDADLEKHNSQYSKIEKIQLFQKEHDRFLMIDDKVYILGDSLKDIGHSLTTVIRTSFSTEEILKLICKK